ncbi:MAG: hypothetical protein JST28_09170 [Acidobacteria bacterium]|nr:hypothetical protein [Acidobacteriota bacterium]
MSITVQQVGDTASEIKIIADEVLSTVETLDPALAAPIDLAEALGTMAIKALRAWSANSGIPITAESVQALLADQTPLSPPTV